MEHLCNGAVDEPLQPTVEAIVTAEAPKRTRTVSDDESEPNRPKLDGLAALGAAAKKVLDVEPEPPQQSPQVEVVSLSIEDMAVEIRRLQERLAELERLVVKPAPLCAAI